MSGAILKLNFSTIDKKIDAYYRGTLKLSKIFAELGAEESISVSTQLKTEIENFKKIGWMIELLTKEAMVKKSVYWT